MSKGKRTDKAQCTCVECRKEFSNIGLLTHLLRAHDKDPRFNSSGHTAGNPDHKGANQYTKAAEAGLPKPVMTVEGKANISYAVKQHNKKYWTIEKREKHSNAMLQAVKDNPDSYNYNNVCRRVERIEYNGYRFHSSWEVIVAKFLDANEIAWSRKVTPAEYLWEGKKHLYFPDFYLPQLDVYVEVKGYEVKKDREKWNQFQQKLIVLKAKEIDSIVEGTFNIETLGA